MRDWKIIVEPMAAERADAAFEHWKIQNRKLYSRLDPKDIVRDTIRSHSGDLVRIRIRVAPQLVK